MDDGNLDTASIEAFALSEARSPRLGITEQFFAVHCLDEESPVACTWKVHERWLVHLRLKDERYFYVLVVIARGEGLGIAGGYASALARVYLALYSKELPPEEITLALGLQPSDIRRKGDSPRKGAHKFKEHRWCVYPDCPKALEFEAQLSFLLKKILPCLDKLRFLQGKVYGLVQVAYYEAACSTSGWSLNQQAVEGLHKLGLELDVDLYVSGPQFLE